MGVAGVGRGPVMVPWSKVVAITTHVLPPSVTRRLLSRMEATIALCNFVWPLDNLLEVLVCGFYMEHLAHIRAMLSLFVRADTTTSRLLNADGAWLCEVVRVRAFSVIACFHVRACVRACVCVCTQKCVCV